MRVRNGAYHVLPFVVNTGGSSWDTPIIGDPALAHLGIRRDEAAVLDRGHDDVLEVPSAVGPIRQPLALEWDIQRIEHGERLGTYDIRMNLVGHEFAQSITVAGVYATLVEQRAITRELAVELLARQYAAFGSTLDAAAREIDALLAAPRDGVWTAETLPLAPDALWATAPVLVLPLPFSFTHDRVDRV